MNKQSSEVSDKPATDSFLKRRWKLLLNIVTVLALIGLAFALRDQLVETIRNLAKVSVWALLLLIPIQLLNYHSQTKMYQHLFATVGNKLKYKFLFKLSLELNFVNHVFPSGGVTGISYFGMRMRTPTEDEGGSITGARATLIQLMKLVLLFLSFEILVIIGVIILAAAGKANNLVILLAGSLTTLMVLGTLGFSYIIGSQQRIKTFFTFLTRLINRLIQIVRPRHPETINIARAQDTFEDLHGNYELFKQKAHQLKAPFFYALIANVTEVLSIYVVYVAFGEWVNLGAVILGYAVANFAGLVSVLPGGVGVYEALLTGVLVATGVPAALSIPVVVMYRVLNTVLQLPPGYYFYHKNLRHRT